jgi:hypothetical protein
VDAPQPKRTTAVEEGFPAEHDAAPPYASPVCPVLCLLDALCAGEPLVDELLVVIRKDPHQLDARELQSISQVLEGLELATETSLFPDVEQGTVDLASGQGPRVLNHSRLNCPCSSSVGNGGRSGCGAAGSLGSSNPGSYGGASL